jgi:hypothetical protein
MKRRSLLGGLTAASLGLLLSGSLGIWRRWAPKVQGQAVKGGHFFPEENPDDTAFLVRQFLSV